MKIKVQVKAGKEVARYYVKKAALQTQGLEILNKEMSDDMFFAMLLAGDSPCKEYDFWIEIKDVPERVHTHMVRHERIGKYVQSQYITTGIRNMNLKIDALRMIEIARLRNCGKAHILTQTLVNEICTQIIEIEPVFETLLYPICVWFGGCPMGKRCCGFVSCEEFEIERNKFEMNFDKQERVK